MEKAVVNRVPSLENVVCVRRNTLIFWVEDEIHRFPPRDGTLMIFDD